MDYPENKLLESIRKLIGDQKVKNIEERLKKNLLISLDNKKDKNLKYFIDDELLNIIKENRIIKDKLLGFKDLICQILVKILNNKKYNKDFLISTFLDVEEEQFTKKMFISILISNKIKMPAFNTLFLILNDKKFGLIS